MAFSCTLFRTPWDGTSNRYHLTIIDCTGRYYATVAENFLAAQKPMADEVWAAGIRLINGANQSTQESILLYGVLMPGVASNYLDGGRMRLVAT